MRDYDGRIAKLRSIAIAGLNALPGAFAANEVSDDFLANLPGEIKAQLELKDAEIKRLRFRVAEAVLRRILAEKGGAQ